MSRPKRTTQTSARPRAAARPQRAPRPIREAWEALSRDGLYVVRSQDGNGYTYVGLGGEYSDALNFLALEDANRRGDAENLWASLRRVTGSQTAFDAEALHLLTLLPLLRDADSTYTRSELRAHDEAVVKAAERLVKELERHPDVIVRTQPFALYWPPAHLEKLATRLGAVPAIGEGVEWMESSRPRDIDPEGWRPAVDLIVRSAPPLQMLLSEVKRQIEMRAATRMQQRKRKQLAMQQKQRTQWARENRLVQELAPRLFEQYPEAKEADVARVMLGLAVGCWNSDVPDDIVLKQVQRERLRTITHPKK